MKAVLTDSIRNSTSKELDLLLKLDSDYVIRLDEVFQHELITCIIFEYCQVIFIFFILFCFIF